MWQQCKEEATVFVKHLKVNNMYLVQATLGGTALLRIIVQRGFGRLSLSNSSVFIAFLCHLELSAQSCCVFVLKEFRIQ